MIGKVLVRSGLSEGVGGVQSLRWREDQVPAEPVCNVSLKEFQMFDPRRGGEKPDVLQTATQFRDHLQSELVKVEEFIDLAEELSRPTERKELDFRLSCDMAVPQRLHS